MTIGVFDGAHKGHQALIGRSVEHAGQRGLPSVLMTFDPPPVRGGAARQPSRAAHRAAAELGVDHFGVRVGRKTGELVTAFIPTEDQLRAMYKLLGK